MGNIKPIETNLPLSWGGTSIPPIVSGTFLEWGKLPLGTLLRGTEETNSFDSLLRDALSAIAAATREEWSPPLNILDEKTGEFKSIEASGSFSIEGADEWAVLSGCWYDETTDL